jgi:hypothetical protein
MVIKCGARPPFQVIHNCQVYDPETGRYDYVERPEAGIELDQGDESYHALESSEDEALVEREEMDRSPRRPRHDRAWRPD